MWDTIWETAKYLIPLIGAGTAWWVKDRRQDRAAADIAERTVPAEIASREAAAADAGLVFRAREMDSERVFYRQGLGDREAEIERQRVELLRREEEIDRQRAELDEQDQIIGDLRTQVNDLQKRLTDALTELRIVSEQLELLEQINRDNHHR